MITSASLQLMKILETESSLVIKSKGNHLKATPRKLSIEDRDLLRVFASERSMRVQSAK